MSIGRGFRKAPRGGRSPHEAPFGGIYVWKAPLGPLLHYFKSNSPWFFSMVSCSRIYFRIRSSSRPTVLTQYPVAQKCNPVGVILLLFSNGLCIFTALLPLMNPIVCAATLNFGGMLRHR